MRYIVYKRFKEKALCGEINIPALTECDEHNGIIFLKDKPLCFTTSENAHNHFVINDDGTREGSSFFISLFFFISFQSLS